MQIGPLLASVSLVSCISMLARAQPAPAQPAPAEAAPAQPPAAPTPAYPPPPPGYAPPGYAVYQYPAPLPSQPPPKKEPPPAHTGFQMHVVTGVMIPFGSVSGAPGDDLGSRYAWQVPFEIGLGAKTSEHLYLGGYLGFSLGAEGSDSRVEQACDDSDDNLDNDITCSTYTLRAGVEVRYFFTPAAESSPWLGYGIGFSSATETIHDRARGRRESTTASGFELARLGFGVDFRLSKVVGLGPTFVAAVGRFGHTRTEVNNEETFDGDLDDPRLHVWGTLGFRVVFFP